jgi:hypothetical protein
MCASSRRASFVELHGARRGRDLPCRGDSRRAFVGRAHFSFFGRRPARRRGQNARVPRVKSIVVACVVAVAAGCAAWFVRGFVVESRNREHSVRISEKAFALVRAMHKKWSDEQQFRDALKAGSGPVMTEAQGTRYLVGYLVDLDVPRTVIDGGMSKDELACTQVEAGATRFDEEGELQGEAFGPAMIHGRSTRVFVGWRF